MEHRYRRVVIICTLLAAAAPAAAEPSSSSPQSALLERLHERIERLAEPELRSLFMRCSSVAEQQVLGFAEAAYCSTAYEVLKARSFGGNFEALLAWWREARRATPSS